MAQEGTESPGANRWPFSPCSSGTAVASGNAVSWPWQPPARRSLMDEAFVAGTSTTSFTEHTPLSMGGDGYQSAAYLSGEPAENHMHWIRALLNVEAEVQNGHGDGGGGQQMLEPAVCDYLKQMDRSSSRQLNLSSLDCLSGQTNYRLSNLNNWSVAPPKSNLNTWMDHLKGSRRASHSEVEISPLMPPSCPTSSSSCHFSTPYVAEASGAAARRQIGIDNLCPGIAEFTDQWPRRRNPSDQISFGGCSLSRQASTNASDFCDGNKNGYESSTTARNGTRIRAQGKKKKPEDRSESLKKSKLDGLLASEQKVPKVVIAEKMSALQQLVSAFGKTDQASVFMETIICIKMLQEQVQLLTDPYLQSNLRKDHSSWVDQIGRKEKAEVGEDLRSRGLCLVPISSIPQVHRESNKPSTPAVDGSLRSVLFLFLLIKFVGIRANTV